MRKILTFFLIAMLFSSFGISSGVKINGFVQNWFSLAQQYNNEGDTEMVAGFKIHRVRVKFSGEFSEKLSWYVILIGDNASTPKLLDAAMIMKFSKEFNIKVGQFVAPSIASGGLTPSSKLDFVERPQFSKTWAGTNGLFGWRAMGIQFNGTLAKGKLYYAVMFANYKTLLSFNPSVKSAFYSYGADVPAITGRFELRPVKGLSMGAFAFRSKTVDNIEKKSYGFNLFYVKDSLKLKGEYAYGSIDSNGIKSEYDGFFIAAGYKIKKLEPILRFDSYTPKKGGYDKVFVRKYNNFTLGLNYFYCKHIKVQFNYIIRSEDMAEGIEEIKNNLFYVNFQYSF